MTGIEEYESERHCKSPGSPGALGGRRQHPLERSRVQQENAQGTPFADARPGKPPFRDHRSSGGLDSSALLALSKVLKNLAERKDITVMMAVPVPELVEPVANRIAIVAHGEILAFDTAEGLRKTANCAGDLKEVLERLIHPEVLNNIDKYLQNRTK